MHTFQQESETERKKRKFYLSAFILIVAIYTFIDFFDLGSEKVPGFRIMVSLLFNAVIFYLALRRKFWAEVMVKVVVWLNIFLLLLIIIITSLGLK
ncbi:hypothetical protein B0H99_10734 [Planomicrobium soli]|uniref:Uncharacterized protein n=1 Tax=Planomicrobium soli TaxID=1176648 RepID=A0A2P8GQH3_9BACL|nr:hypothetical protein [Planomicrobium soli]PSL36213.1 hypothetical protein B0H99_10734 [Planomicrobium soli]